MAQFIGTALDDVLDGTSKADRFDLSQGGNDAARGLRGDDRFLLGAAFTVDDIIDGGVGNDTLVLNGNYFGGPRPTTGLHSVEIIRFADGFDYSFALDDANTGAGKSLTVDARALTVGSSLEFDASAESDGTIIVKGGSYATSFYGGTGANIFDGGAGGDFFTFNGGRGEFHGGVGSDRVTIAEGAPLALLTLRGGADDSDWLIFDAPVVFLDVPRFTPGKWGFEHLEIVVELIGTGGDDYLDFSGLSDFNFSPFITGMDGNDVMIGGDGFLNRFYGMAGNDRLYGGDAADEMTGGTGRNRLYGNGGDDSLANFAVFSDGAGRTLFDGGDGDDRLWANNGRYLVYGGNGADWIGLDDTIVRQDTLFGGDGIDTLALTDEWGRAFVGVVFDVELFDAETSGIESLAGGTAAGSDKDNTLDFSGFTLLTDFGVTLSGLGGADYLAGTYGDDALMGGRADDILTGTAGRDALDGGIGDDSLTGGLGQDHLTGSDGADTYVFSAAAESTGSVYDTIDGFNARGGDTVGDSIDLWFTVGAVRDAVEQGSLSDASFDADLAAAIGAAQLSAYEAILFRPDEGSLAGGTFLVIDANGTPGYQPGDDLGMKVLNLTGALDIGDFT